METKDSADIVTAFGKNKVITILILLKSAIVTKT